MIKEFKEFLFGANILDLAVTVVVGIAFNVIVTSLVEDVITSLFLDPTLEVAGVERITELSWHGAAYGSFLSAIINFLIVGTTLFFIIKAVNAAPVFDEKRDEVEEEATPTQGELPTGIHDLLKEK